MAIGIIKDRSIIIVFVVCGNISRIVSMRYIVQVVDLRACLPIRNNIQIKLKI
jgi:hypothetical protein